MQQLFNVSERFSKALDDVRGPRRKRHFLKQAKAWVKPSGARRVAARTLAYGGVGLVVSAIGLTVFRNRRQLGRVASNVTKIGPVPKAA